jgi:hypothetical protein
LSFGGGDLGEYGINSNTSANGFAKCTYKKKECETSSPKKKSPEKVKKTENEDDSDELAEDSERDDNENMETKKTFEWVAMNSYKDLY